jgi:hypothetical protein
MLKWNRKASGTRAPLARSPKRLGAEAREGSDRNPRRAKARGDAGESPAAGVQDAGGHAQQQQGILKVAFPSR